GYDIRFAQSFFALSIEERLSRLIEATFSDWCMHLNDGISLVYDNACAMINGVTENIFAVDLECPGDFEIFSSRLGFKIETGHDQFNPDAGGFTIGGSPKERLLFMFETGVRAMSAEDATFAPRYLLPEDPSVCHELGETFGHVFSAQLRFWTRDLPDYQGRYDEFRASLDSYPDVKVVEKNLSANLRRQLRFRLKRKEPVEFFQTPVTAIAIGRELVTV
ncbi:MAG TPA: hypothetical protein VEQ35_09290, partial [Beijerinckia sp.]|nr:hypothetical protein [Beijerinckia sp.]